MLPFSPLLPGPTSNCDSDFVSNFVRNSISRIHIYLERAGNAELQLSPIKATLKATLKKSILERMNERGCNFSQLDDGDFRDILEALHAKLDPVSSEVLSRVGFKTVSAYSVYSNSRAADKIKALTQVLDIDTLFNGFEIENIDTVRHSKELDIPIVIPIVRYDKGYRLNTEEDLRKLLNAANNVSINIPYARDNRVGDVELNSYAPKKNRHLLPRPIHNGTHGVRQVKNAEAIMASIVASGTAEARDVILEFTDEERLALKMAAFFLRSGRIDERGWLDGDDFAWRSSQIFQAYASQTSLSTGVVELVTGLIRDSVKPEPQWNAKNKNFKEKLMWNILSQAHHLDLYRCRVKSMGEIEDQICDGLTPYFVKGTYDQNFASLSRYAKELIVATGSTADGHRNFSSDKFKSCSENMDYCFREVDKVVLSR